MAKKEMRHIWISSGGFLDQRPKVAAHIIIALHDPARAWRPTMASKINADHSNVIRDQMLRQIPVSSAMFSKAMYQTDGGNRILNGPVTTRERQAV